MAVTMTLPLMMLASLAFTAAPVCTGGRTSNPDTKGNCCWPDQVWSATRKVCVGIPRCPENLTAQGEDCILICPSGMEVGADTAGHCCYPSQVWSGSRQTCVGIPRCPEGLIASGEMCVPAGRSDAPSNAPPPPPPSSTHSAPPPTAPPPTAPPPSAPPPPPESTLAPIEVPGQTQIIDGLTVPPGHHVQKQARKGLLIPGIALLGAGWLVSVLVSVGSGIYVAFKPSNTCWAYASSVGWIPLVGPPIAIGGQGNPALRSDGGRRCVDEQPWYSVGVGVAVVDTIMQWGGLTMMILGLTLRQSVVVEDQPVSFRDRPLFEPYVNVGAEGTPLGFTLGVKTW
jgi:hypothetical protein